MDSCIKIQNCRKPIDKNSFPSYNPDNLISNRGAKLISSSVRDRAVARGRGERNLRRNRDFTHRDRELGCSRTGCRLLHVRCRGAIVSKGILGSGLRPLPLHLPGKSHPSLALVKHKRGMCFYDQFSQLA